MVCSIQVTQRAHNYMHLSIENECVIKCLSKLQGYHNDDHIDSPRKSSFIFINVHMKYFLITAIVFGRSLLDIVLSEQMCEYETSILAFDESILDSIAVEQANNCLMTTNRFPLRSKYDSDNCNFG